MMIMMLLVEYFLCYELISDWNITSLTLAIWIPMMSMLLLWITLIIYCWLNPSIFDLLDPNSRWLGIHKLLCTTISCWVLIFLPKAGISHYYLRDGGGHSCVGWTMWDAHAMSIVTYIDSGHVMTYNSIQIDYWESDRVDISSLG